MSKQRHRKRDKNEVEHLRGELRELQKQNRQLRKQLKHLEKRDHLNELNEPEEPIEKIEPKVKIRCTACGKGFYDEFEILDKVFGTCNIPTCGDRKRLK